MRFITTSIVYLHIILTNTKMEYSQIDFLVQYTWLYLKMLGFKVSPLNKNQIKVTLYYNGEINCEIDQLSQKTF